MIAEIGLADDEQAWQVTHQFIVHPEPAHRVMNRRVDTHRLFVGIFAGDALVHFEEIPVPLLDLLFTQSFDRIGEVQVDAASAGAYAESLVAYLFRRSRSDIAWRKISVARIFAFEVVVAVGFGNHMWRLAAIFFLFRHPDAPVVAQ